MSVRLRLMFTYFNFNCDLSTLQEMFKRAMNFHHEEDDACAIQFNSANIRRALFKYGAIACRASSSAH
jgi:hypothetical protein